MEIKRYDIVTYPKDALFGGNPEFTALEENPKGKLVHYEDVEAKLEKLGSIAESASNALYELIGSMAPRPIDSAPKDGTPILLRYIKNGKNWRTRVSGVAVWTEARYLPPFFADWDTEKKHQYGDEWYDHLDRLICNMRSPSRKNIPTHWLPIPPEVK